MIAPFLLAASLAAAQTGAPTVAILKERFIEATDDAARSDAIDRISRTAPSSGQDVSSLFDLFSRFSDPGLRKKVMDSLALIPPDSPQLEPLFVSYLQQPEPEAQLFGINGAFRLRSRAALPLVRKIAERKFAGTTVSAITVLSQRNAWWAQYEALSALAQWEGEKALPLLREKADEAPEVAGLLGRFFWAKTIDDIGRWADSDEDVTRQKAAAASGASIDPSEARATRAQMIAIVRDVKADETARHRLALKIGASSTDAEAAELIKEHDAVKDDRTRLLWAAAAFASRSKEAVPLLKRYALESPDAVMRKGARAQLVDMLGEEAVKGLLGEEKAVQK